MQAITLQRPLLAALMQKACDFMDVILHLGAHRTATTSFQHYLRENADTLGASGIRFWGPRRTRNGLLTGVIPGTGAIPMETQFRRARGRIALNLKRFERQGVRQLVVSDENMIGAPRRNLRSKRLYGGVGERMARFSHAFDARIARIVLSIRCLESYWASVAAFSVARGYHVPAEAELDRLVTGNRHWREMITDLACAVPDADIVVLPYEEFGGHPEAKLAQMTGLATPPRNHSREWMNRAPSVDQLRQILKDRGEDTKVMTGGESRWNPFNRDQATALREAYADDLYWLRSGAEGLATLTEETRPAQAGKNPLAGQTKRGHPNGTQERRLA